MTLLSCAGWVLSQKVDSMTFQMFFPFQESDLMSETDNTVVRLSTFPLLFHKLAAIQRWKYKHRWKYNDTQMEIQTHIKIHKYTNTSHDTPIQTQIWNTDTNINVQMQKDISGLSPKQGNFDGPCNYY